MTATVELGAILEIAKGRKPPEVSPIPKPGFVQHLQIADLRRERSPEFVPANGAVIARKEDVLICWDGSKAGTSATGLTGAAGSTIAVLRIKDKRFLTSYVAWFLNTNFGRLNAATIGAAVPHIDRRVLEGLVLPIHSKDEQWRITNTLDKANAIRRKPKEAIALTEKLLCSAFLEMFGDPVTNPKGWLVRPLSQLGRITTGNTPSRAVPEYFGDTIEWIKSDNINTPSHFLTKATEGLSAIGKAVGRTAPSGSTLMTCIAGSPDCIGNVALADREVSFNQQINAITPLEGVDHRYLYVLLLVAKRLVQAASTNSMKGMVSKGKLEEVRLPSPPLDLQAKFGKVFERILRMNRRQETAHSESERLFQAVLYQSFGQSIETRTA